MYGYIRAGRFEDAIEMCHRANQPWRAASIRGSLLFQWRAICKFLIEGFPFPAWVFLMILIRYMRNCMHALATEQPSEDSMDEDGAESWSGNPRRKLWKSTCVQAALNVRFHKPSGFTNISHHKRYLSTSPFLIYSPHSLITSGYSTRR